MSNTQYEDCWKDPIPHKGTSLDRLEAKAKKSAWSKQVGGSHYKDMGIQPMQYSMENKLDALQHTAIKYITRFREKKGIKDLEKAKHCIDMLIEWEADHPSE